MENPLYQTLRCAAADVRMGTRIMLERDRRAARAPFHNTLFASSRRCGSDITSHCGNLFREKK